MRFRLPLSLNWAAPAAWFIAARFIEAQMSGLDGVGLVDGWSPLTYGVRVQRVRCV